MSNQSDPKINTRFASCMNHLKHGSTSKSLFLQNENPDEFFAALESAFEQYQPTTDYDAAMVTRCVHDHWILLRRERTADAFEAALHTRKPDPTYWVPVDLNEMHLIDRYKTEASRAHARSLKNLQTIKKIARDDQRWQHQLEIQKQRLAIHLERFALLKAKSQTPPKPPTPASDSQITQTVYIGFEDGVTTHFETTPTNSQLRRRISESDNIVRTYNFIGGVPPAYEHLVTPDAYHEGAITSVRQTLSFADWQTVIADE
jgi:hypothetical protein